MPTLPSHKTLGGLQSFQVGEGPELAFARGDTPLGMRGKLNQNFELVQDFTQQMEIDVEDISAAVWGRSLIDDVTLSIGAGLNIDYTSGDALIGFVVSLTAGSIPVLANASPGYVYLDQSGAFTVNLTGTPPVLSNFELCRYTSNGTNVLSIIESARDPEQILPAKLRIVTGSTLFWCEVDSPTTGVITHARQLKIPGFKTVTSQRSDITAVVTQSDLDTETQFRVLLTYTGAEYYYSGDYFAYYLYSYVPPYYQAFLPVWVDWVRTGLAYEI